MEPIKDPKFDVDKMIDSVIDYTELFLTWVKEVVKSGKELEEKSLWHIGLALWIQAICLHNKVCFSHIW